MNRTQVASALVLAAAFAGNAFAEGPIGQNDAFVAATSRAQVQAELVVHQQARVNTYSSSWNPLATFKSAASRDAVVGDYLASRAQVAAFTAEDSGSSWLAQGAVHTPLRDTLAGQPVNAQ
jgi:hypothetical protein